MAAQTSEKLIELIWHDGEKTNTQLIPVDELPKIGDSVQTRDGIKVVASCRRYHETHIWGIIVR